MREADNLADILPLVMLGTRFEEIGRALALAIKANMDLLETDDDLGHIPDSLKGKIASVGSELCILASQMIEEAL